MAKMDTWTSHPFVSFPQTVATKFEVHNCTYVFYFVALIIHLYRNLLLRDNAPVHKISSMKTCFASVGVEELEWPSGQSPTSSTPLKNFGINWNADSTPNFLTWHQCMTSLVVEWANPHTAMLQYLVESFPEDWRLYYNNKGGIYKHIWNIQLTHIGVMFRCAYFWQCSVKQWLSKWVHIYETFVIVVELTTQHHQVIILLSSIVIRLVDLNWIGFSAN